MRLSDPAECSRRAYEFDPVPLDDDHDSFLEPRAS